LKKHCLGIITLAFRS